MRPLCIASKGDRSALRYDPELSVMIETYAQDQADMYDWEIPEELEGVPEDWIERCLFYKASIGICPYNSKTVDKYRLTPGSYTKADVYNRALRWKPTVMDPNSTRYSSSVWTNEQYPLLELSYRPLDFVYEYIRLRYSSMISAGQNTVAMRQPIAIKGQVGDIGIKYIADMIEGGNSYIPVVDGEDTPTRELDTLDLGAQNFLDPLTGFIDATDSWASRMLGTDSASTQKESGISIQEVTAGDRRVKARRNKGLKVRREWCGRVAEALNVEIEVYLNDEYDDSLLGVPEQDGLDNPLLNDESTTDDTGKT